MALTDQFDEHGNQWDDRGFWVNVKGQIWKDDGTKYGTWVDTPAEKPAGTGTQFTFGATSSGGGGGGGGADPTRYTQHTDTDGSVTGVPNTLYQLSSTGAMTVIRWGNTAKDADPGPDADGDGYDDRTGFPVGVVASGNSPSGYFYKGQPVNPDGSLYTGTPKDDTKVSVRQLPDGGMEGYDPATGKVVWSRPGDAYAGGSSSRGASGGGTTVRTVGNAYSGGGGSSGGGVSDAQIWSANEAAAGRAANSAENANQRAWQEAQNSLDRQQRENEMRASLGMQAQTAAQSARDRFVSAISSADPGHYAAMLATQGGTPDEATPTRMLGLGQTALSPRLLESQNAQLQGLRNLQAQAQQYGMPTDTTPIVPMMAAGGTIFDSMFGLDQEQQPIDRLATYGDRKSAGMGVPSPGPAQNATMDVRGQKLGFDPYGTPTPSTYGGANTQAIVNMGSQTPTSTENGRSVYSPGIGGGARYAQPQARPAPTAPVTPPSKLSGPTGYVRENGVPDWFEQMAFGWGVTPSVAMLDDWLKSTSSGLPGSVARQQFNQKYGINMQVQRDENNNIRLGEDGKPMYQAAPVYERDLSNQRNDPMWTIDPQTGKAPMQLLQEMNPGFDWAGMWSSMMSEPQDALAGDWFGSGGAYDPLRSELDAWIAMLMEQGGNPFGANGGGGTMLGDPSANPVWQEVQQNAYNKASAKWKEFTENVKPEWDHGAGAAQRFYDRHPGQARSIDSRGDFLSKGNTASGGKWDGYVPSGATGLTGGSRLQSYRDLNNVPSTYTDMGGNDWYVDANGGLRRKDKPVAGADGLPGNGVVPGQTYDEAMFRAAYYIDPKTGQMMPKAPNSWPPGYTPKIPMKADGGMVPGMAIAGEPRPGSNEPNPEMVIAPQGAQVIPLRQLGLGMGDVREAQRNGGMDPRKLGMAQQMLKVPMRADGGSIFGQQQQANPWLTNTNSMFQSGTTAPQTGGPSPVYNPAPQQPPPVTGGPLPLPEPPPVTGGPLPLPEPPPVTGGPLPPAQPQPQQQPNPYVTGIFPGYVPPGTYPTTTPPPSAGTGGGTTTTGPGAGGGTTTTPGGQTVEDIRNSVTVPDINPFDLRWEFIDPSVRTQWANARQTKYGIPVESSQFEPLRNRLSGMNRSSVFVGV